MDCRPVDLDVGIEMAIVVAVDLDGPVGADDGGLVRPLRFLIGRDLLGARS